MNQRGCYGTPARIPSTAIGLDGKLGSTGRDMLSSLLSIGLLGMTGALVGRRYPGSADAREKATYLGTFAGIFTGVMVNELSAIRAKL